MMEQVCGLLVSCAERERRGERGERERERERERVFVFSCGKISFLMWENLCFLMWENLFLHDVACFSFFKTRKYHWSHCMRKPTTCKCENNGADQLCGHLEADQHL